MRWVLRHDGGLFDGDYVRPHRAPGAALGLLFAVLALATFGRMGMVAAQLNKMPDYTVMLAYAPMALWLAGGIVFVLFALSRRMREAA